jgi:hypothetical protein
VPIGEGQRFSAPISTTLIRADSLPKGYLHGTARTAEGRIVALPLTPNQSKFLPQTTKDTSQKDYQSINAQIGAMEKRKRQEEELALEDDPQQDPPGVLDFIIAILYLIFGVMALFCGLVSIFNEEDE